jgi:hypothetical protein
MWENSIVSIPTVDTVFSTAALDRISQRRS